jgi:ABC-type branched-subunit amino acid transport system substrate-binding protein
MNKKIFMGVTAAVAICASLFLFDAGHNGYAQTPPPATAATEQDRQLTPTERRGRAIYLRGESLAGREIIPSIGDLEVPAATVHCAGCHGLRGEGKTEGGVSAGNLTWTNLTKSYGHTHANGRKHGPFTLSSFILAVVHGVDPNQNRLGAAMPRYRISAEDMADLIAYLKRIEFDQDPGLTADTIEVGVPLPTQGPLAEVGAAMREVLTAYFDDLNVRGGIYNRKIKLHFTAGEAVNATFASARDMARQGQAFAFVGGLSAGADIEMAAVASAEEVPFVGPSTLLPQTGKPPNRYVFYLLPGAAEQARALINFADTKLSLKKSSTAVVYQKGLLPTAAGTAAMDQARARGWSSVVEKTYEAKNFDATQQVRELKAQRIEALFFFGDSTQVTSLMAAANVVEWKPNIFLLGTLAAQDINNVPALFKGKIFLAFPTVPADITAEGSAEYRTLLEKYKVNARHRASQFAALAAAKTFVEGLKRAGADLTREQLVSALEGLYEFDTGLTSRLTFGPNRRIGAAGAHMVTVNPETKEFSAVGGWISAN